MKKSVVSLSVLMFVLLAVHPIFAQDAQPAGEVEAMNEAVTENMIENTEAVIENNEAAPVEAEPAVAPETAPAAEEPAQEKPTGY